MSASSLASSAAPCRFWQSAGGCLYGADCKYLHAQATTSSGSSGLSGVD